MMSELIVDIPLSSVQLAGYLKQLTRYNLGIISAGFHQCLYSNNVRTIVSTVSPVSATGTKTMLDRRPKVPLGELLLDTVTEHC